MGNCRIMASLRLSLRLLVTTVLVMIMLVPASDAGFWTLGLSRDVKSWSSAEVGKWCDDNSLSQQLKEGLDKHGVTGSVLLFLDESDLIEDLQITSKLERKKILLALKEIQTDGVHDSKQDTTAAQVRNKLEAEIKTAVAAEFDSQHDSRRDHSDSRRRDHSDSRRWDRFDDSRRRNYDPLSVTSSGGGFFESLGNGIGYAFALFILGVLCCEPKLGGFLLVLAILGAVPSAIWSLVGGFFSLVIGFFSTLGSLFSGAFSLVIGGVVTLGFLACISAK